MSILCPEVDRELDLEWFKEHHWKRRNPLEWYIFYNDDEEFIKFIVRKMGTLFIVSTTIAGHYMGRPYIPGKIVKTVLQLKSYIKEILRNRFPPDKTFDISEYF